MGHKTICVSNVSCLCVCAEEPNEQRRVERRVKTQLLEQAWALKWTQRLRDESPDAAWQGEFVMMKHKLSGGS